MSRVAQYYSIHEIERLMDAIHTHTSAHVSVQTSQKIDRKYICYYYSFASQIAQTSAAHTPLTQIAKFCGTERHTHAHSCTSVRWRWQIKTKKMCSTVFSYFPYWLQQQRFKVLKQARYYTLGCVDIRGRM